MDTKEDRWFASGKFNEATFEDDKGKIIKHYKNYGYINARIQKIKTSYRWANPSEKTAKNIIIKIWVYEGDKYYFGSLTIKGNKLFKEKTIRRWFKRKENEVFSQEIHEYDIGMLRAKYSEKGYIFMWMHRFYGGKCFVHQTCNKKDSYVNFIFGKKSVLFMFSVISLHFTAIEGVGTIPIMVTPSTYAHILCFFRQRISKITLSCKSTAY